MPTQIMCFMYNNILSTIVSRIGPVWTIALGPFSNNKDASLYLKIMDRYLSAKSHKASRAAGTYGFGGVPAPIALFLKTFAFPTRTLI